jgi:hypothetical protein
MYKHFLLAFLLTLLIICIFYKSKRIHYIEYYDDIDPSSMCQSTPTPPPSPPSPVPPPPTPTPPSPPPPPSPIPLPPPLPTPTPTPGETSGPSNYNTIPLYNWEGKSFKLNDDWVFEKGESSNQPCGREPTNGNVCYSKWDELISYPNNKIRIDLGPPIGDRRKAIRIQTEKMFNGGLFIIDVDHIPAENGVWPAIWLVGVGKTWPENGEIDIIEGVSNQDRNASTLHTKPGCIQSFKPKPDGSADCNYRNAYEGCGVEAPLGSFGKAFNEKGGVYVCEWIADKTIKMWLFDKDEFKKVKNNDTSSWKNPYASFKACSGYFKDMVLIINTTTCGDWAGNIFKGSNGTSGKADCEKYVLKEKLPDAYWLISSIRVYNKPNQVI